MTCKLQMVITFATVVCLRHTICQNAHNSEENPWARGFGPRFFPKKCLELSQIHIQRSNPPFFFKLSATFFLFIYNVSFFKIHQG